MGNSSINQKEGIIRYSTVNDLEEILIWLKKQDQNGTTETFFVNRKLIIESHNNKELLVYIDPVTNRPIAYQLDALISPGILEVRADKRGQGIGKKLVEYRIKEARENDRCLLQIQCKPQSSIPFWEHMGFCLYGNENYAFKLLEKKLVLPINGTPCQLNISFYPEERIWEKHTDPIKVFTPLAVKIPDDGVYLSDRVAFFYIKKHFDNDLVTSIIIDDQQLYLDKAKYDQAKVLGIKKDGDAYYIDKINLKSQTKTQRTI